MDAPVPKSKLIKGVTGDWEVVIGMEVHAQVTSQAKLFSGASTAFGGEPNAHVSLVDAAMPGMLPVINEECVRQAVRTGLGLKAKINLKSVFDRKNYFYPDLPQGYQISQYKSPIVGEGEVVVDMPDGETVRIGIERLHLEQDAGKLLHDQHASMSLVDLNRSGVALMEIVTKPDLRSADEAKAFVGKLRTILRYLGTCDGDMEKGNLRADVNVSVRKPGAPLGTRCEIKNLNSIRFIGQAIEHEARRQIEIIEDGGTIEQETRLFDPDKGETRSMRSKEEAHDYRYFPDPDLLPLELSPSLVADLQTHLPELPDEKKARFMRDYALSGYDAGVLVAERETAEYLRSCRRRQRNGRRHAARSETRRQLGDQRARAGGSIRKARTSPLRRSRRRSSAPSSTSSPGRHDLRQDRQGRVRDRLDRGRRPARDRRGARAEAGDRPLGDREARRRHRCQEPRQGRRRQDQPEGDRLVRRSGDESVGRQGQSAGRQRSPEEADRGLSATLRARRTHGTDAAHSHRTAETEAKISLAAAAARHRMRPRKRAASANRLALIRAFCAAVGPSTRPQRRPVHNFFAVVNPPTATSIEPAKARYRRRAVRALSTQCSKMRCGRNPHFIGTSASCLNFSSAIVPAKNFFAARSADDRGARRGWRRGAALTHNIKRSHCYFFPAVVIGW